MPDVAVFKPVGSASTITPELIQSRTSKAEVTGHIMLDLAGSDDEAERYLAEVAEIENPEMLDPRDVVYPQVFGNLQRILMSREEVIEELDLIVGMGWPAEPSVQGEPYIYGLQILEPSRYEFGGDPDSFGDVLANPGVTAELRSGILTHETLYKAGRAAIPLLANFLEPADLVRISLQGPQGTYRKIDVQLG